MKLFKLRESGEAVLDALAEKNYGGEFLARILPFDSPSIGAKGSGARGQLEPTGEREVGGLITASPVPTR